MKISSPIRDTLLVEPIRDTIRPFGPELPPNYGNKMGQLYDNALARASEFGTRYRNPLLAAGGLTAGIGGGLGIAAIARHNMNKQEL